MLLDLRFPIHLQARPPRSKEPRDVLLSKSFRARIEDVSRHDAPVYADLWRLDRKGNLLAREEIRYFEGEAYRFVGGTKPGDLVKIASHGIPSSMQWRSPWLSRPIRAALVEDITARPVASFPIVHQIQWDIYSRMPKSGDSDTKEAKTWPVTLPNNVSRGDVFFEWQKDSLRELDEAEVAHAESMAARQAGRLLIIDEEIWYRTPPLGYVVEIVESSLYGTKVDLDLAYAADGPDASLTRAFFTLDRLDEASAYADSFGLPRYDNGTTFRVDGDSSTFRPFDTHADLKRRTTASLVQRSWKEADRVFRRDGVQRAVFERAMDRVMETNWVLERFPDISDLLPQAREWTRQLSPPPGRYHIGLGSAEAKAFVERIATADDLENPISIKGFMR